MRTVIRKTMWKNYNLIRKLEVNLWVTTLKNKISVYRHLSHALIPLKLSLTLFEFTGKTSYNMLKIFKSKLRLR